MFTRTIPPLTSLLPLAPMQSGKMSDQRFRITASNIARFFKHQCDRQFRWDSVEGANRGKPGIGWNVPKRVRSHSRPGIKLLMESGDSFEVDNLRSLMEAHGEERVYVEGIAEQDGGRKLVLPVGLGRFAELLRSPLRPTFVAQLEILLPPDVLERALAHGKARGFENRTINGYMRYLKDAFIFAHQDLKWITEEHNLSNVKFRKLDQESAEYDEDELLALWPACQDLDLRLAVVFAIAMDTGRRVNPIRNLRTEDIKLRTVPIRQSGRVQSIQLMAIEFPGEKDKAGKTGLAYLTPSTRALVEELLDKPVVQRYGWLIPNRRNLDTGSPYKREAKEVGPAPDWGLNSLLKQAEQLAGIDHIKGRAFHGIKRGSVTIQAQEAQSMELVAKQTGTTAEMLRARYFRTPHSGLAQMALDMEARWQEVRPVSPALRATNS